ncbi:hypothetical protein MTR67_033650 [Solanum verrucosum]|uniref:Uncharacterized protein n=1 Tax=Solanum verrucosum TaxID=315347 RepID=A0AAF0ZJH4_SOLVR|nr:hypothetical protein MTR67_033650 [Solanum verrucosum]
MFQALLIYFGPEAEIPKEDITKWNREVFGQIESQRHKALMELGRLDQIVEQRTHTPEENVKSLSLKLEIQQIAIAEEISWRQKSRCLWLKEGDKNKNFFQRMINSHRRSNCIDRSKIGDDLIENKELIKRGILAFYLESQNSI